MSVRNIIVVANELTIMRLGGEWPHLKKVKVSCPLFCGALFFPRVVGCKTVIFIQNGSNLLRKTKQTQKSGQCSVQLTQEYRYQQ